MSFKFNVVAKLPPAVMMVIGAFLIVLGVSWDSPDLYTVGIICVFAGVLLQVLFLFCMRRPW